MAWYRDQLPASTEDQVPYQWSSCYFHKPDVPRRVWQLNPAMRLLLITCDPVQRLVSEYVHNAAKGTGKQSLSDCVSTLEENTERSRTFCVHHCLSFAELAQTHPVRGKRHTTEAELWMLDRTNIFGSSAGCWNLLPNYKPWQQATNAMA